MIPNDPRSTDALANYVHVHDPDYVPPKVTVTTSHGFSEADLLEVARRAAEQARNCCGFGMKCAGLANDTAEQVVRDFLKEREGEWNCPNCGRDFDSPAPADLQEPTVKCASCGRVNPIGEWCECEPQELRDAVERAAALSPEQEFEKAVDEVESASASRESATTRLPRIAAARTEVMRLYREKK